MNPSPNKKSKVCRACELGYGENSDIPHNRCFYYPKLYIKCFNILVSMYAQRRLNEEFGFEILGDNPHFTSRFVVVRPPKGEKYKNDKPIIVSGESADEDENWMDLFDALNLISFIEHMKKSLPPTS